MTPDRQQRAFEIFDGAIATAEAERECFVAMKCAGDQELAAEVRSLLAAHVNASGFLSSGVESRLRTVIESGATTSPALRTGDKLGGFLIENFVGAGGMGEVYRAHDARLRRDIALKILPTAMANDPERRRRLQREAQLLAALNHPHIAAIYGFEETAGVAALVLELVEGPTLADRLAGGALPLDEALTIARQIAEALEAAHAHGIVHRDLKPANVKVTPRSIVKVLDFGLAKAVADERAVHVTEPPTMTAIATQEGVIAGTAPYMSPEQARGKTVDKRADIWAFGCVLYEMLAGGRAFRGDTTTDVLAAVVDRQPDYKQLPRTTPDAIRRLLLRCLEKDPDRRLRDIREARLQIDEALAGLVPRRGAFARLGAPIAITIAVAVVAVWMWNRLLSSDATERGALRRLTADAGLTTAPALSLDGTLIAYASDRAGEGSLDIWVQQTAGGEPIRLTHDPADDTTPDFSPDSTQITFRSERNGGGVYRTATLGGEPTFVAPAGYNPRFSPDGRWIAYHTGLQGGNIAGMMRYAGGRLYIAPSRGGDARRIQPSAKAVDQPIWSPDSKYLLMLASFETGFEPHEWWVTPLQGAAKRIDLAPLINADLRSVYPTAWLPGNRVVFSASAGDSRNSWMVTLSPDTWQIQGRAQRLTSGPSIEGATGVVAGPSGLKLAFATVAQNIDVWTVPLMSDDMQPAGSAVRLTDDTFEDMHLALTTDGRTLLYSSVRRDQEIWARDLVIKRETRLISMAPAAVMKPVLSRDGSKLAFHRREYGSEPSATFVVDLRRAADGTLTAGTPRQLPAVAHEGAGWPWSWSPDGTLLWYDPARWPKVEPNHLYDVATRRRVADFGHPEHDLSSVQMSPDGRWAIFLEQITDTTHRLVAAPVKDGRPGGEREWIEFVPAGSDVNWPAWSTHGDVVYFTWARDGFVCVWGQRVSREMRPIGPPVAVYHAHTARLSIAGLGATRRGLAVARDKIVFNMSEISGNIWLADVPVRR